ncbi:MAG: response regulator [Deltaproteobacteria bacterium]|nr:response regulator [Deltaproteobacteria bacterium]
MRNLSYHRHHSINEEPSQLQEEWLNAKILLVDDEPRILGQLEQDLGFANFSLFKALNAEEGLSILKEENIQLIICDQRMPKSMLGTEFLYEAKKIDPNIVGIILSAYGSPEHLFDAINRAKAFSYLLKPWNKVELFVRLKQALEFSFQSRLAPDEKQIYENIQLRKDNLEKQKQLTHSKTLLKHAMQKLDHTNEKLKEKGMEIEKLLEITGKLSEMIKVKN